MLTALITGQFRRPDVFARTLPELRRLRERRVLQDCVVATWAADAERFAAALAQAGFAAQVLVCRPPQFELPIPGHALHQQTTLRDGLAACADGKVLRLRSDTFIAADLVERVLQAMAEPRPTPALRLYDAPIWTPWIDYEEPFHVADEMLLGQRRDLLRLARFDIRPLAAFGFPLANIHTMAFFPDRQAYPRLYFDFLAAQRDAGVMLNDPTTAKFAKLDIAIGSASYLAMLGVWYRAVADNFLCFSTPDAIGFNPGGGAPAGYYAARPSAPASPRRLFDASAAGFHNHFYIWDLVEFRRGLDSLDRTVFAPLLQAYADPTALLADTSDRHAVAFAAMLAQIKATVPVGKTPYPCMQTQLRRAVRRWLTRALKAVG